MRINDEVLRLWDEERPSDLVPQFYDGNLNRNALLFVGLNPSFYEDGFKGFLKGSQYEQIENFRDYFSYQNFLQNGTKDQLINHFINIEKISKCRYTFYTTQSRIAEELALPYEHIDLFFKRDTDQKNIKREFKENENSRLLKKQLELFKKLLDELEPKIIVVANAFARKIFRNEFPEIAWDNKFGTYRLKEKPVFFTSMLSGSGALDTGSMERLKWHLRNVKGLLESDVS